MDVLYLKNAEVESFNGCGYCKWANKDPTPPPKHLGYSNPGWPGCCRPPQPNEHPLVPIADWPAVSVVHRIGIPKDIESLLSSLALPSTPSKPISVQTTSLTTRAPLSKPSSPSSTRKNSGSITPSTKSNILSTKPMNTPTITRGRSPHGSISPGANLSRSSSSSTVSSSVPNSSYMENPARRKGTLTSDRRVEGTQSASSSPSRKSLDLENPISPRRVSSVRRPAPSPATTSVSVSRVSVADSRSVEDKSVRSRGSSVSSVSVAPRMTENFLVPRSKKDDDCSASSSSGSSDGMGSLSDSTVTSDGGFTDYLSDESEAELQRQAEARAAVVAQNQQEEQEFKMARQQLAHVGLKPPKSWNPNNTSLNPSKSSALPGGTLSTSRNANVSTTSFAVAAAAMMQTGQARG
ncbi:hypothetical protein NLJ89_g4064 [Agrocybe chaxingu]|uniref:Uncharacterized protein n=1 Tax=Agrocybe chaxingu TaxID=84603 RepID=A0A9W8K420_9AGAR|nr:hypothetical protein NLJ89_g4064 [Agrocybe chaxingu]